MTATSGAAGRDGLADAYVLLEQVGRGQHSVVHRAQPKDHPGRVVAVKRIAEVHRPEAVPAVHRQTATLRALEHPALLVPQDIVTDGDGIALVLPWAPGRSLVNVLARRASGMSPTEVAAIGARVASALAAVNDADLVHGNVTASNILFDAEGRARLADVGTGLLHRPPDPDETPAADLEALAEVLHTALGAGPAPVRGELVATIAALEAVPADDAEGRDSAESALADHFAATVGRRAEQVSARPGPPPHEDVPIDHVWPKRLVVLVAAVVVAVIGAVLLLVGLPGGDDAPTDEANAIDTISAAPAPDPTPTVFPSPREVPPLCNEQDVAPDDLVADVDGSGCGIVLTATTQELDDGPALVLTVPDEGGDLAGDYRIGEELAAVVVGDWDCDGTDTPAVVRPTGEAFTFDDYGALTSTPVEGAVDLPPRVVTDGDCDVLARPN